MLIDRRKYAPLNLTDKEREFYALFLDMGSIRDIALFFDDLLTPAELKALVERWQICKMLTQGKSQREIQKELGVGIMTVTRGAQMLKHSVGGMKKKLERFAKSSRR